MPFEGIPNLKYPIYNRITQTKLQQWHQQWNQLQAEYSTKQ